MLRAPNLRTSSVPPELGQECAPLRCAYSYHHRGSCFLTTQRKSPLAEMAEAAVVAC